MRNRAMAHSPKAALSEPDIFAHKGRPLFVIPLIKE